MSFDQPRKIHGQQMITAHAIERELTEVMPRVVRRETAKILAFKAGVSQRQAEAIKAGHPTWRQAARFLALAQQNPELKAWVAKLLNMDMQHDPRALALLDQIERYLGGKPEEGDRAQAGDGGA